jgi:iron(III) transport system permease protein
MLGRFVVASISKPSVVSSVVLNWRQLVLLGRSLGIALSATVLAFLIGLPAAFALASKDLRFRNLLFFLVLVPVLIPPYVLAGAWIHLLSPTGLVNQIMSRVFGPEGAISIHCFTGCVWCLGISFYPIVTVIVSAGLAEMDGSIVDLVRLSCGRWKVFCYGICPQIWPYLIASFCLVMIFALGQYGVPSLLGLNTYPVEIFAQFSAFYDEPAAIGTAIPLMVMVVLLILLQRQVMRGFHYVRINPASETNNPLRLGKLKRYAILYIVLLFFFVVLIPFLSVLVQVRSMQNISKTLSRFGDSISNTTLLALPAAIISVIISWPIGKYLAKSTNRFSHLTDVISWLPIAIGGTIMALGAAGVAGRFGPLRRADSFGVVLLCTYIGMFSAFAIRIFRAAFERADPNIDDAVVMERCRWYQRLLYVDIPVNAGAIAAAFIIVFVLVLGELNATVLLIPPGKATLSVAIDNLLHYGANVNASVLCLVEAGVVILMAGGGLILWRIMANSKK